MYENYIDKKEIVIILTNLPEKSIAHLCRRALDAIVIDYMNSFAIISL